MDNLTLLRQGLKTAKENLWDGELEDGATSQFICCSVGTQGTLMRLVVERFLVQQFGMSLNGDWFHDHDLNGPTWHTRSNCLVKQQRRHALLDEAIKRANALTEWSYQGNSGYTPKTFQGV